MKYYTAEKILALLKLVDRPLTVRDMLPIIRPDDADKGTENITNTLSKLKAQGKVTQGPDRFCKDGCWSFWCKTWKLAEVEE